jgi:CPA2 family monovalent cation:H+ antiporter-2
VPRSKRSPPRSAAERLVLHAQDLKGLLIFLVAAGIVVPLFHRARIGTVLGFLVVGVALGPFGLGRLVETYPWLWYLTFDDPERVRPAAELGIIFLLFLLGLELSLERLWQLRRYVLGVGAAQVALSALAIGLIVYLSGVQGPGAVVLGLCLALSSTAIAMQLLIEQHRSATQLGRIALSVLLFQDLMVVPILFVVGVLGRGTDGGALVLVGAVVQALVVVALIMAAGRYMVRPLLRPAGRTGSRDLIMAITLLIVIGIAAVTGAAGLSTALGAFLAGLLLSESEYRHHIEVDLEPFKGLLLGVFFITVGTNIDLRVVAAEAGWILLAVGGLIIVKAAILVTVVRAFGVPLSVSANLALILAQAGEFAFVVIGLARDLFSPQIATSAFAVVGLSMLATPFLAMLARPLARRLEALDHKAHAPGADGVEFEDHVVIGGFGRVGQTIAHLLEAENISFVALDADSKLVAEQHRRGRQVYFGDASRRELLERAGALRARAFVVTLDAPGAAERMVDAIRKLRPDAPVFARAKDPGHAANLAAHGAFEVIPEAVEASLQLGARVLENLGVPEDTVMQRIDQARDEEAGRLVSRAQRSTR